MSYFDLPRLHLTGRFFCDPSSVNNDPVHYKEDCERPAPWQMPDGLHYFRFFDCRVMGALDENGGPAPDKGLLGAAFKTVDTPVPAKMVDLDVYQQGVTQLFGVQVSIQIGNDEVLNGKLRTPALNGAWFQAVLPTRGWEEAYGSAGSYGADSSAAGVFQTVIEVAKSDWKFPAGGAMAQLLERTRTEFVGDDEVVLLSFKFVLDGYRNVPGTTEFQTGRFVGTIGPLLEGDPAETPGARWLEARPKPDDAEWFVPQFVRAPFHVDEKRKVLQVDWAGCLSRVEFGGRPADLGEVKAVVAAPGGPQDLGLIVIDERTYKMSAGISELTLTDEQVGLLSSAPLELWTSRKDIGPQRIFFEAEDGVSVSTENRSVRMTSEPERDTSRATSMVILRRFGKPMVGATPEVKVVPVKGGTPGATVPPSNPGDTPQADGALGTMISTSDEHGVCALTFEALKDPGSRTKQLDGQLYFVYAYFDPATPWKNPPMQEAQVSVLVWAHYEVKKEPTWADIHELMVPYAKLYPGMKKKFDLADEQAFVFYANNPGAPFFVGPQNKFHIPGHPEIQDGAIPYYITLPIEDPRYMPVTRDLSPPKIETILNFISIEQAKKKQESGQVSEAKGPRS